jgi:hypothetical protein
MLNGNINPQTVDWFGAINRYTAGKRQAAQQQDPALARSAPASIARGGDAVDTRAGTDDKDSESKKEPKPKPRFQLGPVSDGSPSVVDCPTTKDRVIRSPGLRKKEFGKPKRNRRGGGARHLLVRGVDNSDWYAINGVYCPCRLRLFFLHHIF